MAMLIVSDSEFELELSRLMPNNNHQRAQPAAAVQGFNSDSNNQAKILDIKSGRGATAIIAESKSGRGPTKEIPSTVRNVIAGESISGTPAKVIQQEFPISQSSISAYKCGATSTASLDRKDAGLVDHNNKLRHKISHSARNRLILALKHITDDKLVNAKVKDAASVAKDMSTIIKNMNEQTNTSETSVQFVIHRPRMREMNEFEIIDVTD